MNTIRGSEILAEKVEARQMAYENDKQRIAALWKLRDDPKNRRILRAAINDANKWRRMFRRLPRRL